MRRDQRGFTLVELLMVMVVSSIVLGAAVTTYASFLNGEKENQQRNSSSEQARFALDVQARQLRNLAQRINEPVIAKTDEFDFIFQTSDPVRTWVRYCLDTKGADKGQLWEQTRDTIGTATSDPCPGPVGTGAWKGKRIVAADVTNRRTAARTPVFTYTCTDGTSDCVALARFDQIVNVGAQLLVDTNPGVAPPADRVATGVHLRNQNQAPVAKAEITALGPQRILLNASGSSDYEARTLEFYWFKDGLPATSAIKCADPRLELRGTETYLWGAKHLGQGVTLTHKFTEASGTPAQLGLVACDPGGLSSTWQSPSGTVVP